MFRTMRRSKQSLPNDVNISILENCTSGTLGVLGDDDYPYTVPLSYYYNNGKIYFHCAKEGHKIDAIKSHNKVSFSVIQQDNVIQSEYTTYFRSVIVFGKIRIMDDETEIRQQLRDMALKYSPDYTDGIEDEINSLFDKVCMLELSIEHMTGKESKKLAEKRQLNSF